MYVRMCEQPCYQPLKIRIAVSFFVFVNLIFEDFSTAQYCSQLAVCRWERIPVQRLLDTPLLLDADCRLLAIRSMAASWLVHVICTS